MNVVLDLIQSGWTGVLREMIIEKSRDLRAVWLMMQLVKIQKRLQFKMERVQDQEGQLQFRMKRAKDQEGRLQFKMERAKNQERECVQVSPVQSQLLVEHFPAMS